MLILIPTLTRSLLVMALLAWEGHLVTHTRSSMGSNTNSSQADPLSIQVCITLIKPSSIRGDPQDISAIQVKVMQDARGVGRAL